MNVWAATLYAVVDQDMSRGISKKTKKLALGAMLAAIGAVILLLGSLFNVIDLSMAALASFVCIIAVIELGSSYAWLIYAVVGVLSVILRPVSFAPWVYVAFLGYYPIIKEKFEKTGRFLSWLLKILTFNVAFSACIAVIYLIMFKGVGNVFTFFNTVMGFPQAGTSVAVLIYLFVNVVFVIYDIALTRVISTYIYRLRPKFKIFK